MRIKYTFMLTYIFIHSEHNAGNKMDFTSGNFKPKSASSILQALSCRFVGCDCAIKVNSWSPKVNKPPPREQGLSLDLCRHVCISPARHFAIMNYVVINKVAANYVVLSRPFQTIFHSNPLPVWPLPFRLTGISRKRQVFPIIFPVGHSGKLRPIRKKPPSIVYK